MKRIKKLISMLVISMTMLSASIMSVFAANVMPCYDVVSGASISATVSDDGELVINYLYETYSEVEKVVITTNVEKKTFVFFWSDVDSWTDTVYDMSYYGTESIQLDESGTYRVTVEYTFYGADGSTDTVTYEDEVEY